MPQTLKGAEKPTLHLRGFLASCNAQTWLPYYKQDGSNFSDGETSVLTLSTYLHTHQKQGLKKYIFQV